VRTWRKVLGIAGVGVLACTATALSLPASAAAPHRGAAADTIATRSHVGASVSPKPLLGAHTAPARARATSVSSSSSGTVPAAPDANASNGIGQCDNGRWPIGPTRVHGGEPIGVYLRSAGQDVVVDVTHQGTAPYRFSGTITSDGSIRATSSKLRSSDQISVSPDGHTLTFDLKNFGGLTNFHIVAKCASDLTLQANADKKPARLRRFAAGKGSGQMIQGQRTVGRKRAGWLGVPVTFTRSN